MDQRTKHVRGFTLFELVITLTVLSIMVMGTIPLVQNAVRRQNEQRLRESLRLIRTAIDDFKRDTIGACPQGAISTGNRPNGGLVGTSDPRTRVVVDDCTIFNVENVDRFPPSLDILVEGVTVRPRGLNLMGGSGIRPGTTNATDLNITEEITKYYLRALPIDPMTGKSDWVMRSSYQSADDDSWDDINVFDVRSASEEEGLNGVKYSEW